MLLPEALALAAAGWPVFALNGKNPYANCAPCKRQRQCRCGHVLCHGFLAATTDVQRLTAMWTVYPDSNIGLRPVPGMFVLDVDPRNGGSVPPGLPETLSVISGREDDGIHLYFRGTPPGRLGPGLDFKGWGGYVVAPPSLHPVTGKPYRWVDLSVPIAPWPAAVAGVERVRVAGGGGGRGPDVPLTWNEILEPHGWRSPVEDDWLHPHASTSLSARVIDELLYVFSTSTDFEPTEGGAPRGYGRLEAYALLNGHTDFLTALQEIMAG